VTRAAVSGFVRGFVVGVAAFGTYLVCACLAEKRGWWF
jgi:hypothetical protein